jgi:hypothetical protein
MHPTFTVNAGLCRAKVPPEALAHLPRLGACNASPPSSPSAGDESTVVARYTFPASLASPHHPHASAATASGGDDGCATQVDLSTVLAVFDEMSTWAFFSADK